MDKIPQSIATVAVVVMVTHLRKYMDSVIRNICHLSAVGRGWISIKQASDEQSQLPTNQLHDINWGARDHASHASQLMSCVTTVCVCVCMLVVA